MDKPILFNTAMVQAIMNGTKTATRRILKANPNRIIENAWFDKDRNCSFPLSDEDKKSNKISIVYKNGCGIIHKGEVTPPCNVGDSLWVRETWQYAEFGQYADSFCKEKPLYYAKDKHTVDIDTKWRPSIHMPKKIARIFLEATHIKVERLQDITLDEIKKEGTPVPCLLCTNTSEPCGMDGFCTYKANFINLWNSIYAAPQPVKKKGIVTHYESYPWENIQETREHKGKPWIVNGNPWVFAIDFKRKD